MQSLLALDPGKHTGWALYDKLGEWTLRDGGVFDPYKGFPPILMRCQNIVIENPRITPTTPNPESILKLARIVGRFEEKFWDRTVILVRPSEWKGTVDGDIMVKRIEAETPLRDRPGLLSYTGGYRHNMIDAIGLGRWLLKQPIAKVELDVGTKIDDLGKHYRGRRV